MRLNDPLTFAAGGGDLDRASHLRPGSAALLAQADARLLPQWHEKALIDLRAERPALGWVAPTPGLVAEAVEAPVFLGRYQGAPCFTADSMFPRKTCRPSPCLFCATASSPPTAPRPRATPATASLRS